MAARRSRCFFILLLTNCSQPCAIQKQCSSYRLRDVAYSSDIYARKNTITPEASCSLNNKLTFVDNFRFDSDSDTETLSLTDEMVNFFDAKVDNKMSSFTASNAVSCFTTPNSNSNAVAGSSILPALAVRQPRHNQLAATCDNYENECGRNTGATNLTSRPVASSNIALDGYTLLPSIRILRVVSASLRIRSVMLQRALATRLEQRDAYADAQETQSDGFDPFYANRRYSGGISSALRQSSAAVVDTNSGPSNGVSGSARTVSHLPAESRSSASVIEELPADLSITSPFDIFNEAMEEMQKCSASTSTNVVKSSNRSENHLDSGLDNCRRYGRGDVCQNMTLCTGWILRRRFRYLPHQCLRRTFAFYFVFCVASSSFRRRYLRLRRLPTRILIQMVRIFSSPTANRPCMRIVRAATKRTAVTLSPITKNRLERMKKNASIK
ncbi:hypothetical protein U1Q18_051954 [Sarracenia purpurea var. burkii]